MATQRISILGPEQGAPARKAAGSLRLPPTMNNDVFLNALLEMPTTQQTRRSPLKWLSAMGFHIVIVAALIIVPLYTTGTIHLNEYHEIPVVAPPPPLARETHIWGTVVVDAVIDEHGNVVQARVVSGHPLLMDAALKAVLLWKYEPTTLNGQPVSVELQVQVQFKLNS